MSIFRKSFTAMTFALIATLVLPLSAVAQDKKKDAPAPAASAGGGSYKIGVVDIEQVVEGYGKKQRLMSELKTQVDADQAQVDSMTKQLETEQKAYEASRDTMTDADKSAKQAKIRELITNIKAETEKRQGKIDQREGEIRREVFGDVDKAITSIAEAEGYHLILNKRGQPNASVLYSSPTIDITSKVSAQLGAGSK